MVLLQPILGQVQKLKTRVVLRFFLFLTLSLGLSLSCLTQEASAANRGLGGPSNAQTNPTVMVAGTSAFHFAGDRPATLGLQEGRLQGCPESPNCVSSEASDDEHHIEPLTYSVPTRNAMQALKQVIDDSVRAEVLNAEEGYLYAEFTSRIWGFVDDVEFAIDPQQQVIHVRSASRLGESDLGVNRQRIEAIRAEFEALLASAA